MSASSERKESGRATPEAEGSVSSVVIGLCQIHVGEDKNANLREAAQRVREAVGLGAQVVMLPEMFNCPYSTDSFGPYSEAVPGPGEAFDAEASPSAATIVNTAKELGVYVVGGSVPERAEDGCVYNTSIVADPEGNIVAKHRKVHLFDIDVPGKITFRESDTLTGGDTITVFDTAFGRMALGICYDIRFPEYAQVCAAAGARVLLYPGAFNTTTGPAHWLLLQRARAVDNQVFVATCSPARNPDATYQAWGHSTVVDPWGETVATTGHGPSVTTATLDLPKIEETRQRVPVLRQKRLDLYSSARPLRPVRPAAGRPRLPGSVMRSSAAGIAAAAAVGAVAWSFWRKQ